MSFSSKTDEYNINSSDMHSDQNAVYLLRVHLDDAYCYHVYFDSMWILNM